MGKKHNGGEESVFHTIAAGFIGGTIASIATNALEVLTIAKQTNPETKYRSLLESEGLCLCSKGIGARIAYNGSRSALFFVIMNAVEKQFNVKLEDED
jgi:hypothetical protein